MLVADLRARFAQRKLTGGWPSRPITYPSDYDPASNGIVGAIALVSVYLPGVGLGQLHRNAARSWRAMQFVLWGQTGGTAGGKQLTATSSVDTFRPLDVQTAAWNIRMTKTYVAAICTALSKVWNGVRWWLKRGYAQCATPGKSNHGNGLAIDAALWSEVKPGVFRIVALASDPVVWRWMQANAPAFGWYWNVSSESWHLEYTAGDDVPQRVLDTEAMIGPMPAGGV